MNAREFMGTFRSGPRIAATEGSDTACSTPSSHGSPESSFSAEEINFVAGILKCLGDAEGLWLSRGEVLILLARYVKGGA